jgi:hypothetical protein
VQLRAVAVENIGRQPACSPADKRGQPAREIGESRIVHDPTPTAGATFPVAGVGRSSRAQVKERLAVSREDKEDKTAFPHSYRAVLLADLRKNPARRNLCPHPSFYMEKGRFS